MSSTLNALSYVSLYVSNLLRSVDELTQFNQSISFSSVIVVIMNLD